MPMMEPFESFNLTLRGYQKQALQYVIRFPVTRSQLISTQLDVFN
jgi:hypothetical protein